MSCAACFANANVVLKTNQRCFIYGHACEVMAEDEGFAVISLQPLRLCCSILVFAT